MKLSLIKANASDWKILLDLEQEASGQYYHAYTEKEDIDKYLSSSHVFLIKHNDEIVGSISYEDKGQNIAYFDGLIVDKKFRGQGIATLAINLLFDMLKKHEFQSISLLTHPHNTPALKLYLRIGFVLSSWVDNAFGDDEPRVKLVKKFDNN